MLRPLFRRLLLVLFALALPVQGMASVVAHACGAGVADHATAGHTAGHDHAAHDHAPAANAEQHGAHHVAAADATDSGTSSTCSACAPCCSVAAPVPLMLDVPSPLPQFSATAPDALPYHGADADALRRPPRSDLA